MRSQARTRTAPESSTGISGEGERLAISWVHPEERVQCLVGDVVVVGRDGGSDYVVGGSETSSRHAEIRRDGPIWTISDLESTNGTHVNGERVRSAVLGPRTVVRLGDAVGVVVSLPAGADASAAIVEVSPGFFSGPALNRLLERVRLAAAEDMPIVLQGETGSGKERLARFVHETSKRRGPFVAMNCAAIPASLAEAELFGFRRGAFTGAAQASLGHFRAADGGTLLLDEIVELPLSLQPKLLRVLEEGKVTPLGESTPVDIDTRVVVAAQSPLEQEVSNGAFRGDLFARLDGMTFRIPPLRERSEDVCPLFRRFLSQRAGGKPVPPLQPKLVESLCLYDWPFNLRELVNVARHVLVLHGHEALLRRAHLPPRLLADRGALDRPLPHTTADNELERLVGCLREQGGNVARAAKKAGIERARAYRLMEKHELDPDAFRRKELERR